MNRKIARYVIYGSLGMAEHVYDALYSREDCEVVAVVDSKAGGFLKEFPVNESSYLGDIEFDKIVIATMDYSSAVEDLRNDGFGEKIFREVLWEPFFLQIEPTTKCNFSCVNCTRNLLQKCRKNRNMSMDEFKQILDMYPSVKRVQLQGLGEPLMNPDIFEMAELCRSRNISVSLTTNGSLLNEKALNRIAENLDKLIISIDGLEEESFGNLRLKGAWETVDKNIRKAVTYRNRVKIVFNFVVSAENVKQCENIVEFAENLTPSELHIQGVENWMVPSQDGFKSSSEFVTKSRKAVSSVKSLMENWRARLEESKVVLTFTDFSKRDGKCWWPYFGMFISVDGMATPCCIRMQPEIWSFGEHERSIWSSDKYRIFRSSHAENEESSDICRYCPF